MEISSLRRQLKIGIKLFAYSTYTLTRKEVKKVYLPLDGEGWDGYLEWKEREELGGLTEVLEKVQRGELNGLTNEGAYLLFGGIVMELLIELWHELEGTGLEGTELDGTYCGIISSSWDEVLPEMEEETEGWSLLAEDCPFYGEEVYEVFRIGPDIQGVQREIKRSLKLFILSEYANTGQRVDVRERVLPFDNGADWEAYSLWESENDVEPIENILFKVEKGYLAIGTKEFYIICGALVIKNILDLLDCLEAIIVNGGSEEDTEGKYKIGAKILSRIWDEVLAEVKVRTKDWTLPAEEVVKGGATWI